jgi:alpha-tubulin suppressor-like RCC1 family protein
LSHGPAAVRLSAFLLLAFAASAQDLRVPAITGNDDVFVMVNGDGTVSTWGIAGSTGFGDGARDPKAFRTTPEFVPAMVKVQGVANAVAVSAGSGISVALLADGSVRTWGSNTNGLAGDPGDTDYKLTPGPVPGIANVKAIATGLGFVMVQLRDGTLRGWGESYYGGLGNKSGGDWFVKPQTPIGLGPVVAYYPVGRAVFAWKAGGTLMAWGVALMQADGKKTHSNVPVRLDVRAPR